eukprot:Lithocolla_globosa_v1_NODE_711_length_3405_cov_34.421791.p2 type:complete len:167 gc:universal NODE_711_length_3405_cov_34.421791:1449-949(-)
MIGSKLDESQLLNRDWSKKHRSRVNRKKCSLQHSQVACVHFRNFTRPTSYTKNDVKDLSCCMDLPSCFNFRVIHPRQIFNLVKVDWEVYEMLYFDIRFFEHNTPFLLYSHFSTIDTYLQPLFRFHLVGDVTSIPFYTYITLSFTSTYENLRLKGTTPLVHFPTLFR